MSRLRLFLLLPLLVLTCGCGGGNPAAPANISGSVKYKGEPVTAGSVIFYTQAAGAGVSCEIDQDGNYAISDVPAGELIVVVETESANPLHKKTAAKGKDGDRYAKSQSQSQQRPPADRAGGGSSGGGASSDSSGKYVKIPDEYSKPKTSPLKYTSSAGRNIYNIELK